VLKVTLENVRLRLVCNVTFNCKLELFFDCGIKMMRGTFREGPLNSDREFGGAL